MDGIKEKTVIDTVLFYDRDDRDTAKFDFRIYQYIACWIVDLFTVSLISFDVRLDFELSDCLLFDE